MEDNKKPEVGKVFHSLKNSSARNGVFEYLCSISEKDLRKVSAKQISNATGFSERAVRGALIGDGSRYKVEDSLVGLGVASVEEEDSYGRTIRLFYVTPEGQKLRTDLRNYRDNNE